MQKGKREHLTGTAHIAPSSPAETDRSAIGNAAGAGEGDESGATGVGASTRRWKRGTSCWLWQRDFRFYTFVKTTGAFFCGG